jgi:Sulfotransferase family
MSQAGAVQSSRGVQLDVGTLLARARQAAGLTDFGDEAFLEPLAHTVGIINAEARLRSDSELPVQWLVGNLADRLRLVEYLKHHPAALDEKVEVAGIIIGLPRGGSTLLQRLLCTSQQVNHTPWWELISPLPLAGEAAGDPTPRIELGKKMAQGIYDAWPEMVAMHPVEALAPDEEILLIDRTLMCQMFSFYFNVPSYMPWLRTQEQSRGYAELETWLKVLQYQQPSRRGRKWLLKSPHHLVGGGLRTMLDTFRGAKAIMTHRTLENVVVSYCSMQELMVRNYTDVFDPKLIGEQAIDVFRWAIENLIAVRRDYGEQRFIDVQYRDTVERPLEVYRSTMQSMGLAVSEQDEQAARGWMESHGRDTHPPHRYRAEDYGITRDQIARAFEFYDERFLRRR